MNKGRLLRLVSLFIGAVGVFLVALLVLLLDVSGSWAFILLLFCFMPYMFFKGVDVLAESSKRPEVEGFTFLHNMKVIDGLERFMPVFGLKDKPVGTPDELWWHVYFRIMDTTPSAIVDWMPQPMPEVSEPVGEQHILYVLTPTQTNEDYLNTVVMYDARNDMHWKYTTIDTIEVIREKTEAKHAPNTPSVLGSGKGTLEYRETL